MAIVPSHTNIVENPQSGCTSLYLKALEYGLWFLLPNIVMEILQIYDITVAQLVPNAQASILSFIGTCKLKYIKCTALAFTYVHIIQRNNKT